MEVEKTINLSDAAPLSRYESRDGSVVTSGESDSASCGSGDSASGSGAGSCARAPQEVAAPTK